MKDDMFTKRQEQAIFALEGVMDRLRANNLGLVSNRLDDMFIYRTDAKKKKPKMDEQQDILAPHEMGRQVNVEYWTSPN